jgi:glycosyltransferase involved in cell wall biosynthesis
MIVKNEEARLGACLESVSGLFDEVVAVDTGSNDRTKEVAQRIGVKLAEFPWTNDFAAARNESLRQATEKGLAHLKDCKENKGDADHFSSVAPCFLDRPRCQKVNSKPKAS